MWYYAPWLKWLLTYDITPNRCFKWFIRLLPRPFRICWSWKYWTRVSWWTSTQKALLNLKLNFNFILRYNKTFYQKMHFIQKDSYANYLSYDTLWTCVAIMGAEVWHLPWRVIFSRFLALTNTWALVTRRNLKNPPKITLHGNCHSSAPITATKVPRVSF